MSKDLFSNHAKLYNQYRPHYPDALYQHILSFTAKKECAWDCATGNEQAAEILAEHFSEVKATDISAAQLAQATKKANIEYIICPAENTPFADNTFDLVTVAQAYHWFDHDLFTKEVQRTAKDGAVVAIWLYDRMETDNETINRLLDDFYWNITGPYWDSARKHIDDHYNSLPFPYEPLQSKIFVTEVNWTIEQVTGFLTTWSAVQQYIKLKGLSPVSLIEERLKEAWGNEKEKQFTFPIYLKIGRIRK